MFSWPRTNFAAHACDVVGVSIAVNLLLPVAPVIMRFLLRTINVNANDIISKSFKKDIRCYISDNDLTKIAYKSLSIANRRKFVKKTPNLFWRTVDVLFAMIGLLIMWSGWCDDERIAPWCILLLLPSFFAAILPFSRYVWDVISLKWLIFITWLHAYIRKILSVRAEKKNSERKAAEEFVKQAKAAFDR